MLLSEQKNSKYKGNAGIGSAIEYFCKEGLIVSIPLNDSQGYDLVVDFNGELVKPDVEPGQLAYVASHGQHEVKAFATGLEDITIASVLDILAIMKDIETREIQPLGSLIEITKIEQEEEKMGQLYMPDIKRFPPNTGVIKTLGLGWKTVTSSIIPFQVEVGDTVIFNPFSEQTIDLSGLGIDEKKYLIQHGEIQAVLRPIK